MNGLFSWVDDHLNPIVVKELRQAVQGRFLSTALNILLLIEVSILTAFLLGGQVDNVNSVSSRGAGYGIFKTIFGFLLFMTMVVIPLFVAPRMVAERTGGALNLLFISTLPPRRIISGKFLANQLLILMLFTATLPFVSFTYFLRGIDLPSILVVMVVGFVVSAVCLQGMIMVACLPTNRFLRIILGLVCLAGLPTTFGICNEMISDLLRNGVGSRLGTSDFWSAAVAFVGCMGFFLGLFHLVAVAVVSPPTTNRAWPLRSYLSVSWLVSVVVISVLIAQGFSQIWAQLWLLGCGLITTCTLAVAISSPDGMSQRVARSVPRSGFKRPVAFFFWSGSANGVAWSIGISILTMLTYIGIDALNSGSDLKDLEEIAGFAGYTVGYSLTALLLHRRFFEQRFAASWTWALAIALVFAGIVLPMVVGFLLFPDVFSSRDNAVLFSFLNPFAVFANNTRDIGIPFGLGWAFISTVIALPWGWRQVRAFGQAGSRPVRLSDLSADAPAASPTPGDAGPPLTSSEIS